MASIKHHETIRRAFYRHLNLNALFTDQYAITKDDVEHALDGYDATGTPCLHVHMSADVPISYLYFMHVNELDSEGFGIADNETIIYDGIATDSYLVIVYI